MAQDQVALESALFEEMEECERQRPRSWVHFGQRSVGRVVLMHDLPLPFRTHWNGERDAWCYGRENGCDFCRCGRGFKGHYAWAVWDEARRQHGGFDFTLNAGKQVLSLEYHAPSRAGFVVQLRKENGKVNGRFLIESTGMFRDPIELGEPCDIVALVCETYKIGRSDLREEFIKGLGYARGAVPVLPERVRPAPPVSVE